MTTHTRPDDADRVAGEITAVDLVIAYLAGTLPAASAPAPLAADYMEQQALVTETRPASGPKPPLPTSV
ncbi:hypothetical protein [Streptomyces sp. NPDC088847]|uniref:hypothetical protein n=1 Tax=Streptomyces sp. NPDC088847 TaxID=3365909 RepID=UPI0038272186